METRACQNCKNEFPITPEDVIFYQKMKVPAPTFCPECRMIRRFVWRNNRSLYRQACHLCQKTLIAIYPAGQTKIMCADCYNGDGWDQFAHAQDIDWSKSFFEQVRELHLKQPRIFQYRIGTVINSDYGNSIVNTKDAYLSYSIIGCENILYSESVDKSRDSIDCFISQDLDQCSWNIGCEKNYNVHFAVQSQSCIDSFFLFDCTNCQNCCLSSNLRNQQYVFKNQKLTKEAYELEVKKLKLETLLGFLHAQDEFKKLVQQSIHKYAQIVSSQNVTGDYISNSKNIKDSFDVTSSSEEISYSNRIITSKDLMDCYAVLTGELQYETMSGSNNASHQIGSILCLGSQNMEYSLYCKSSSYCFGCVGLKNAQYCIFNKQYSKEEYTTLTERLRKHMNENPHTDHKGRVYTYGEFFPYDLSPFAYNETLANDYFPLNKDQVINKGYVWKEHEVRNTTSALQRDQVPDSINDVLDDVLNQVIACSHAGNCTDQCTEIFKITEVELGFYKRKGLPIPHLCPNCRHYQRLGFRNSTHLYNRPCSNNCGRTFKSTYAPDRPEKVYCETCYQQTVL